MTASNDPAWGRPWTQEEDDDLRVYHANGYTDRETADALGIEDPERIRRRRKVLGLRSKPHKMRGETMDQLFHPANRDVPSKLLAHRLGVHETTVWYTRKALGLPTDSTKARWSPEDLEYLREHYVAQGPLPLAQHFGCKPRRVEAKANALGITRRFKAAS